MTNTNEFASLDIEQLAQRCRSETEKFLAWLVHEAGYCFELMCRAFRDRDHIALGHVYATYLPLLVSRARRHAAFSESCQDADAFARTALANFYHAVNGDKFLEKFSSLAQTMGYLYTCLSSEIFLDVRRNRRDTPLEYLPSAPSEESQLDLQEFWSYICNLLPDPVDQRLAYLRFVLDMKPAEIAGRDPQLPKTQREVSVALYRVRQLLRKDANLRRLAGLEGDSESDDEPTNAKPNDAEV